MFYRCLRDRRQRNRMNTNRNAGFQKFMLLWIGELISAIGSGLTSFGLGIYVYQLTGKASAMALVTLLAFLPSLILSAPAGVLADRYDRRLLMLVGDSFSAIGILVILLCMLRGKVALFEICIGVVISSVFSALMEPSYKATVSDLLTQDEYAKASGMVQIAGSSKYLIAPIIAGFLLTVSDIKLLLIIDICTFFVTVISINMVRKGLPKKVTQKRESMLHELKEGYHYLKSKQGVFILVIVTAIITFFMGFIQTLSTPMILAFTDAATLGALETVVACGMLVSSIFIGILNIKDNYFRMLWIGLAANGTAMLLYGIRANIIYLGITGFLFFATLPFANTGIECLIRKNIDNHVQGRVWGLIGIISQSGYIFSYALCGVLADYIFTPLLMENGSLASGIGKLFGVGEGRGIGLMISVAGLLIIIMALLLSGMKKVRELEDTYVS